MNEDDINVESVKNYFKQEQTEQGSNDSAKQATQEQTEQGSNDSAKQAIPQELPPNKVFKDFTNELNVYKERIDGIVVHAESLNEQYSNSIAALKEAHENLDRILNADLQSLDGAKVNAFFKEIESGVKNLNSDEAALKNLHDVSNLIKAFDLQNVKTLNDFLNFSSENTEQIETLKQSLDNLRHVLSDSNSKETIPHVKEIIKSVGAIKEGDIKELNHFFKGEAFTHLIELAKKKEENAFFNNLFDSLKSLNNKESITNINQILSEISKDKTIKQLGDLGTQLNLFANEKTKGSLETFRTQIEAFQTEKVQNLIQAVNGVNVENLKRVIAILSLANSKEKGKDNTPLIQDVTNNLMLYENFLNQLIGLQKTTEEFKKAYNIENVDTNNNPVASDIAGEIKKIISSLENKTATEIQNHIQSIATNKINDINKELAKITGDLDKNINAKIKGIAQVVSVFTEETSTLKAQESLSKFIDKIITLQEKLSEIEKLNMQEGSSLLRSFYERHSQVVHDSQKHNLRNNYVVFGLLGSILLAVLYLIIDLKTPI
ncbi:hypothetical protein [Helicobacter pylori]|uniref:hypothetical protein n=1 Tax=Helicobacter pylori TaxID=210 RepID=UPI001ABA7623|nr:hypothetical protein [Helicobacter pylori]WRE17270.1 hypothetical protein KVE44_05325 [Helicobacter pylori]